MSILMYVKPSCPFCKEAVAILRNAGVPHDKIKQVDVGKNPEIREKLLKQGLKTVPQIYINDNHVGGCDDLKQLQRNGRLEKRLQGIV